MSPPPNAGRVELRVRFAETDAMGVVYHGRYFPWFEIGRVEFLRARGFSQETLAVHQLHLAVTDVACRYHAPARYDDSIVVYTWLAVLGQARIAFEYRAYRDEAALLTTARTEHVLTNAAGRPVMVKRYPALWENLRAAMSRDSGQQ